MGNPLLFINTNNSEHYLYIDRGICIIRWSNMAINIESIYQNTYEHYLQAKSNIIEKAMFEHRADAISDVIPGFKADKLEFGSYDKENFAVLFVDMRRSTQRAQTVGAEKTFLTMHVFLTALCGRDMLKVRESVINRIIEDEQLGPKVNIGVGVTFDSVIVTKIGIADSYDVKAFGDCINIASHYAGQTENKVKVSKKVKNEWPSGKGGRIRFTLAGDDGAYYLESGS